MARAAANRRPPVSPWSLEDHAELLRGLMGTLSLAAMQFVSQAKVDETARHWLANGRVAQDEDRAASAIADALARLIEFPDSLGSVDQGVLQPFTAPFIARKCADLFDRVIQRAET